MNIEAVSIVEFDFKSRTERTIGVDEVGLACGNGRACWVDMDLDAVADSASILIGLGINPIAAKEVQGNATAGRCDVYEDCFHITLGVPRTQEGKTVLAQVDMILGENLLITLRRGEVGFIEQTRRNYHTFFSKHAETLGFLLFDLWDNLIDGFNKELLKLEEDVEALQAIVLNDVDDQIFGRVNEVTHYILLLRKNVLADREVLEQIAMRKSAFVSPTTQPYLSNMVGTLERLDVDLTTEREILAELLALYLGIVSHRTNRVVNRLTTISVIFLPLSFLCGVYGMNFNNMPELQWQYGIVYFWALVIAITVSSLALMRWKRWL